jgi:hypothetical protein
MHDDDHLLREDLRRIDPARDLAPHPPTWLSHRMEQIMTTPTSTAHETTAEPARARRVWIVAAAAALAVGAAVVVPLALAGAPTTEVLALPNDGGTTIGSCLPVTPEGLSSQEKAFAANAIAIDGDTVTLHVTERFAGDVDAGSAAPTAPTCGPSTTLRSATRTRRRPASPLRCRDPAGAGPTRGHR